MDKEHILNQIRGIASANGGKAPGIAVFERETGISRNDWFPHLWLRWGDAVVEAGYAANQLQGALSEEFVLLRYIELVRELGKMPIKGELLRKAKADKTFPSEKVFYRGGGGKEGLLERVVRYCQDHPGHEDVIALCSEYKQSSRSVETTIGKKTKITSQSTGALPRPVIFSFDERS